MRLPPMVRLTIRLPRQLKDAALAQAEKREENLSEQIRKFLERYAAQQ